MKNNVINIFGYKYNESQNKYVVDQNKRRLSKLFMSYIISIFYIQMKLKN